MLDRRSSLSCDTHAKALRLLFITALLAVALGAAAAQPVQAKPGDLSGAVSPKGLLNPDGTLDLSTGFEGMLDLSDWQVTLDSERRPVLREASGSTASPVPGWHSLSSRGLSHKMVFALAVVGSDLYAGGEFAQTGDGAITDLGNIARYNTTTGTWHALSNQGLNDDVRALAVVGSDLYVGGTSQRRATGR